MCVRRALVITGTSFLSLFTLSAIRTHTCRFLLSVLSRQV